MSYTSPDEKRAQELAKQSIAYQGDRVMDAFYAVMLGTAMGFTLGFMVSAILT
jgi:hypothetical protein